MHFYVIYGLSENAITVSGKTEAENIIISSIHCFRQCKQIDSNPMEAYAIGKPWENCCILEALIICSILQGKTVAIHDTPQDTRQEDNYAGFANGVDHTFNPFINTSISGHLWISDFLKIWKMEHLLQVSKCSIFHIIFKDIKT